MLGTIATFISAAIIQGTPLLFGSVGEIITEKSGNLNLGIPGIMYMGGISGIIGGYLYEHYTEEPVAALCIIIPLLATLLGSGLLAAIYSFHNYSESQSECNRSCPYNLRHRYRKLFRRLTSQLFQ